MPADRTHRIRIAWTLELSTESLRGLWAYHCSASTPAPFSVKKARELARRIYSDNPEAQTQIHEGLEWLEAKKGAES